MMDEFDLEIKQVPIGNYWITMTRIKDGMAMNMHLDYDDILKIRDHLNTLIDEKEKGEKEELVWKKNS